VIEGKNLTKIYGKQQVLTDVSIEIREGEITALLGKNGSGKSTLLNILAMAVKPDRGSVYVNGEDASGTSGTSVRTGTAGRLRRTIAYVPQDIALFEELTMKDNLYCWSRLSKEATDARIDELEETFHLREMEGKKVIKLSGGMKRRVNFAAALMGEYKFMILDEPLTGLDEDTVCRILKMLEEKKRQGVGIIISGHDKGQLLSVADKKILLKDGVVVEDPRESATEGSAEDPREDATEGSAEDPRENATETGEGL